MRLEGAKALVTGGAHRLGRAIALRLAQAGADVAISYQHSADLATETMQQIEKSGVRALALRADASDPHAMSILVECLRREWKRVDVLVANAGAFRPTPLATVASADWHDMLRDNFETFLVAAQAVVPVMASQQQGCIVALSDVAALRAWAEYIPYSVAKSCVLGLARSLAAQLAPAVRVNVIAPGPVLFPADFPADRRSREISRTALKREGGAACVADAVAHLVANDYVTGTVLPVDGGRMLS